MAEKAETKENGKQSMRREQLKKMRVLAIAAAAVAIMVFAVLTVYLYRERKKTEAEIAAREYHARSDSIVSFQSDTVEYGGKTYRRNSYVKAILCMGVDRKGTMLESTVHTFGGQADGIFLIAQDTARNDVKILSVPRDTMTEITLTDLSGNELGKDIQHLTLAYAYGDGREKSCELVMEAVSNLMDGLKIDHYMAANTEVINMVNNSIGGVTVTIPSAGMEKKDPAFVEGAEVKLLGEQAEAFVRYRDTGELHSAIYRMDRQKEYITQFFKTIKLASDTDSQIVTRLFGQVEEYMVTDMGKEEYLKVALDALDMDGLTDDDFYVVPGQAIMTEVYDEFHPNKEALIPIILELFYREV